MKLFKKKKKLSKTKVAAFGLFGIGSFLLGALIQKKSDDKIHNELREAKFERDQFASLIHWKKKTIEKESPWLTASDKETIEKAEKAYREVYGTAYPN